MAKKRETLPEGTFTKSITYTRFKFYTVVDGKLKKREEVLLGGLSIEKARAIARKTLGVTQCIEPQVELFKRTFEFNTAQGKEVNQ